jgi:hypothetical protein
LSLPHVMQDCFLLLHQTSNQKNYQICNPPHSKRIIWNYSRWVSCYKWMNSSKCIVRKIHDVKMLSALDFVLFELFWLFLLSKLCGLVVSKFLIQHHFIAAIIFMFFKS